jgi:thioredoxin-like negative regulator of GroEL
MKPPYHPVTSPAVVAQKKERDALKSRLQHDLNAQLALLAQASRDHDEKESLAKHYGDGPAVTNWMAAARKLALIQSEVADATAALEALTATDPSLRPSDVNDSPVDAEAGRK